jgi:hypothetical protein
MTARHPNDLQDLSFLRNPIVIIFTVIRFLSAAYILYSPYPGLIISIVLDIVDAQFLIHIGRISRRQYHVWDKNVDWLCYVTELWVGSLYGLFLPFFLLLFYRFLGQFMFMRSKKTVFFVFFPNFFEFAFLWLVLTHPRIQQVTSLTLREWWVLGMLLGAKLVHEFLLHYVWPSFHLPHVEDQERWLVSRIRQRFSDRR